MMVVSVFYVDVCGFGFLLLMMVVGMILGVLFVVCCE